MRGAMMDHHTRFMALVLLAMVGMIPLKMRVAEDRRDDRKVSDIMNEAAINDKAERTKVMEAARAGDFTALPESEVKPAQEIRAVMLENRRHFRPQTLTP